MAQSPTAASVLVEISGGLVISRSLPSQARRGNPAANPGHNPHASRLHLMVNLTTWLRVADQ
jgi:hypothetical protein